MPSTLGLLFKVTSDSRQAQADVNALRQRVGAAMQGSSADTRLAAEALEQNLTQSLRSASREGEGLYNAINQVRIGLTQLGRGDIGGIPNLIRAQRNLKGDVDDVNRVLGVLDAALVSVGAKATRAKDVFTDFQDNLRRAAAGSRELQRDFDALGINVTRALLNPDKAFSTFLQRLGSAREGSRELSAGLNVLGAGAGQVSEAAGVAGRSLGAMQAGLGGVGAASLTAVGAVAAITLAVAAAAAAMVVLANRAADAAAEIQKVQDETGLSADSIQRLTAAAKVMNVEMSSVSGAFKSFTGNVGEARRGNEDLIKIFRALGVSAAQAARDPEQAFEQFVLSLSQVKDESLRAAVAQRVLGTNARDLIRLFTELNDRNSEVRRRIEETARAMDGEALKAAEEYNREVELLKLNFDRLATSIGAKVLPALNNFLAGRSQLFSPVGPGGTPAIIDGKVFDPRRQPASDSDEFRPGDFGANRAATRPVNESGLEDALDETGRRRRRGPDPAEARRRLEEQIRQARARSIEETTRELERELRERDELEEKAVNALLERRRRESEREIAFIEGLAADRLISQEDAESRIAEVRLGALTDRAAALELLVERAEGKVREVYAEQLRLTEEEILGITEETTRKIIEAGKRRAEEEEKAADERLRRINETKQKEKDARESSLLRNPASPLSIFGEEGQAAADRDAGLFGQVAAAARGALAQVSDSVGNVRTTLVGAFSQIGAGLQGVIQNFILTGQTGPAAFKKLAAGVIASVAAQSLVKAIFETAEGFAALARYDFVAATNHFAAAKTFAIVGGIAAGVGIALSAGSGGANAAGGQAFGGQNTAPPERNFRRDSGQRGEALDEQGRAVRQAGSIPELIEVVKQTAAEQAAAWNRIQAMPAGHMLAIGAAENPRAVGAAVIETANQDAGFNEQLGRRMRLA